MLTLWPGTASALSAGVWIDLLDPTDEERAAVEQATKLHVPTKAAIKEIESSSRVFIEDGALYLSTPVLENSDCLSGNVTTIGFVLSSQYLITLRFTQVSSFTAVAASYAAVPPTSPRDALLRILETIVDHTADALEHASAQLEEISHLAFHTNRPNSRRRLATASAHLRAMLRRLGAMGDGISHLTDTLLGLDRIAAFVNEHDHEKRSAVQMMRLNAIRGDLGSLNDYQDRLTNKIQFLLDATLGFINIDQNDIVKTLTVVSVVGVPPVLIAGIYGMNFRNIPEFNWAYGYPYALGLILVSALLPIAWMKWRGWM